MNIHKLHRHKNPVAATYLMVITFACLLSSFQCDQDTNSAWQQWYSNQSQKRGFLESIAPRLGNSPTIDPDVVYNGVVDPNNIAIHVAQNFVNFAAGTLAWFLLSFTFEERTKRSTSRNFPQSPIPLTIKAPPPNSFGTEDFLTQYYNNYQDQSSSDSTFKRSARISRSANNQIHEESMNVERKDSENKISSSKHMANMFRSLADAADSLDR